MNYRYIVLGIIVSLAAFFRLVWLADVPPSPSLDEVSIGYNAYSILKTGADEYGTRFPLLLRAYDDWRPALYVYFVIPFVWIFGLTATAVRLPSVVLSIFSVWATYELVRGLLEGLVDKSHKTDKTNKEIDVKEWVALVSALLLAISPWHIYISRLGHEANAGMAFFIFGGLFFLKKRYMACAVCYSISFMSYQSEKIVVPLILSGIGVLFYKQLWNDRKKLILPALVSLALITPFMISTLQPEALVRFKATNIAMSEASRLEGKNKLMGISEIVASQYISHYDPMWLLTNEGTDAHKVPRLGILYWWEALFSIVGIIWLIRVALQTRSYRTPLFLLGWLLTGPVPASITTGAPHVMRSMTSLPVWQILAAAGFVYSVLLAGRFGKVIIAITGLAVVTSIYTLYFHYFYTFPSEQSESFQYALSDAVLYAREHEEEYDHIVFSNEGNLYQSYMFFLFGTRYDPATYLKKGGTISGGYAEPHEIETYSFRPIDWEQEKPEGKTLYTGNADDIPEHAGRLHIFRSLSGDETLISVER